MCRYKLWCGVFKLNKYGVIIFGFFYFFNNSCIIFRLFSAREEDYGPDAYIFAEEKPLQLINGSNLLYLLEQHGHIARIDLKEAKKL